MNPEREKMTPVDRIRDLERRMEILERGNAPQPGGARPVRIVEGAAVQWAKLDPPAGSD